ncbi:hypothetical protein IWW48_001965 [Coemansia sp. RSA 1200]|nr:hypothetical protein IWW48_001965 [Coemansia sp. RSA 1200]
MRYRSPYTQIGLISLTLLLTHGVTLFLQYYLLQKMPQNDNPTYDTYWPTSAIACVSGFASIFLINLIGLRIIFVAHTLICVLYSSSVVVGYKYKHYAYHKAMFIINSGSYDVTRVAILVVMLTYASERWKARGLGVFLFIEYFSLTMGDVVAITHRDDSQRERFHASVAMLVVTCLAPFAAAAVAPTETIVRNNGVYLVACDTNLRTEAVETVRIFGNRYMLLLLPYMFAYPFAYSTCAVLLNDVVSVLLYDLGKIFVIAMGLLLDIPWSTRKMRAFVGFANLWVFFTLSIVFTMLARMYQGSWRLAGPKGDGGNGTVDGRLDSIFAVDSVERNLAFTSLFFTGVASSMIELFGLWVIGTLTNDVRACCRFVGTFHSTMFIGGMLGIQVVRHMPLTFLGANLPMIVGNILTYVSLVCIYFVIRRISDTNDWTLARISSTAINYDHSHHHSSSSSFGAAGSDSTVNTFMVVTDVKYRHEENARGDQAV